MPYDDSDSGIERVESGTRFGNEIAHRPLAEPRRGDQLNPRQRDVRGTAVQDMHVGWPVGDKGFRAEH